MQTGQVGPCWWVILRGTVTPEDHAQMVETLRKVCASRTPVGILHVIHDASQPSPEQRRQLAGVIESAERPENIRGYALVTNSAMIRGALTAINWLVRTPIAQRPFGHPAEALTWLVSLKIGIDAVAVEAAMVAADPGYRSLRW